MNVSLTPELERFIDELVETGDYRSPSEVVRAAVRLLKEREEERRLRLEALRNAIGQGLEELEQGRGVPGSHIFDEILSDLGREEAA